MKTEDLILNYIMEYIVEHLYPPSYQEICQGTGVKSKETVHKYIRRLADTGRLETDAPGGARALRVPGLLKIVEG